MSIGDLFRATLMKDDAESAHDDYTWAVHLFHIRPDFTGARAVEDSYRRFYVAFTGGEDGLDGAMAEMRQRLVREMVRVAA